MFDAAEAADIQSISGYDGSASDYDISDNAALISAGDGVLNVAGVDVVSVSDGATSAQMEGILAGFTADVEFDVVDNAGALVSQMSDSDRLSYQYRGRTRLRLIMMVLVEMQL